MLHAPNYMLPTARSLLCTTYYLLPLRRRQPLLPPLLPGHYRKLPIVRPQLR